jgi:hypothetical protein
MEKMNCAQPLLPPTLLVTAVAYYLRCSYLLIVIFSGRSWIFECFCVHVRKAELTTKKSSLQLIVLDRAIKSSPDLQTTSKHAKLKPKSVRQNSLSNDCCSDKLKAA